MSIRAQLTYFDRGKIQPFVGLRNAIGLAIPLGAATAAGEPFYGLLGSLGAMNAALSDGSDPYLPRGGRMLAASALGAVAIAAGAIAGSHPVAAGSLILIWCLGAGLLVALDQAAADIGLLSLVMVLVFVGQPMSPDRAVTAGLLALAGGCLQTVLSVSLWPFRRYEPERRVIAALYSEIAAMAASASPLRTSEPPRGTAQANQARAVVRALGPLHTVQSDRYVALVSQAERIRLSVLAVRNAPCLKQVSLIADAIARSLRGEAVAIDPQLFQGIHDESLAGQLRAASSLAASSTMQGRVAFEQRQLARPWRLRVESTIATLRANLTLRSSAMRHALRLTAAVLTGELLGHASGGPRSYWLPMTAAIVLKPDFTATFTRGFLRIAGTFVGLALATALFRFATPTPLFDMALVVVIVFVFRAIGPAHFGIATAALTAYIVVIFALAGQRPAQVIGDRALHTLLGGALALAVYAVWPTWEGTQIRDILARMLDAYRVYFRAIHEQSPELDNLRLEARLTRSNAEAALDRFFAESDSEAASTLLTQIMASSHRLVHAIMELEARWSGTSPLFMTFAHRVEITLHSLAAALRGAPLAAKALPDLRTAQVQLADSGSVLAGTTDRLTNSLNTLSELVARLQARVQTPISKST